MKILFGASILLIITGATLSDTTGISGTWMVQTGIILLFGTLTVFSIERYSIKKNPVIWKVIGITSFALMIFLSIWGYLNVIWNVHPLGFIIALAGCIWVFYHGTKRGFAKIFIAIVVGVLVISSGIYFGVKQSRNYQTKQAEEKERQTQALAQMQQEIDKLKEEGVETKSIQSNSQKPIPQPTEVQNSEKNQVKTYVSTILNTYIPERTKFYRIDDCIFRDTNGEFKTNEAVENCIRQVWIKQSAILPNLISLLGSISVPAPMATFAFTERITLDHYSFCKENQIKQLDGEIGGFNVSECNQRHSELFQQAQDEFIKIKKKYGL